MYYGAELFWREQRIRMASIVDSTPVSGAVMIASKWTALAALIGSVLLGGAAAGVALQVSKGYFDFQPFLYLSFFYFTGVPLLLYAAASLFIHALSPGKYAGMIFFVLFMIVSRRAAAIGLEHDLWRFAAAPSVPYTELNGFGHYAAPFHWFMLHWTVLALLLAGMAAALWRRVAAPLKERLRLLARPNMMTIALLATFAVTGGWIFYNTNVAHAYVTTNELLDWKADYEKTYKRIETMPRPRISRSTARSISFPPNSAIAWRDDMRWSTNPRSRSRACTWRRAGRPGWPHCPFPRRGRPRKTIDSAWSVSTSCRRSLPAPARSCASISPSTPRFRGGQQDDAVVENGTFLMNIRAFPTLGYRDS